MTIPEFTALIAAPSSQTPFTGGDAVARALGGERVSMELRRRRRDGTEFDALATVTPWRVGGQIIGATSTVVDISERKQAERERQQALADMQEAQRLAKIGSWSWNPATDLVTWSAQAYELFGHDPQSGPLVGEAFLDRVHPRRPPARRRTIRAGDRR